MAPGRLVLDSGELVRVAIRRGRSSGCRAVGVKTAVMPLELPSDEHGFILARDARTAGREAELAAAVRSGDLERIRRGVYLARRPPDPTESAAERDARRYLALVRASAHALERPVYTSYSAAALMGLPIIGRWPDAVYVMSRDAHGSRRRGVIAVARTHEPAVVHVGALAVTSVEFTLMQFCRHAPLGAALVATDAALLVPRSRAARPARTTPARLAAEHERLKPYPGSRRTDAVLRRAVTAAETPLETASRLVIEELGFAPPVLQHELWLPDLRRRAYLDFHWPGVDVAGEADGHGKYRGDHGEAFFDAVIDEKDREDAIRAQVRGFARWSWADIWQREPLRAKLVRAGVPLERRRTHILLAPHPWE